MKTKYTLFRRGETFYMQDSATGRQTSLRTKDETEAASLLNARNAAQQQPTLNLHLARAYLTASDPAFVERTWQTVMEQLQSRGKDSSRERYKTVFKSASFDALRQKKLLETTADDFFAVFKDGKVSIVYFLKRLHNFALSLGWIALPVVAPYLWPKYEAKERRGITPDEQQSILAIEKKAEWKFFLELLWETGAAQGDAAAMTAEDVDWQSRTITYFRAKTGSRAQFTISKALEIVLSHLPTTGVLFPKLSTFTANDRASRFRRRCERAGVSGVTLHSYRYAWAERAKVVGMPTEKDGRHSLPRIDRERITLYQIFEKFVANFYKISLRGWEVRPQRILDWNAQKSSTFMPSMKVDVLLTEAASGHRIVLDTKFTAGSLISGQWGSPIFDSGHVYQIYAYLRSQEHLSESDRHASGILLYPTAGTNLNESVEVQGHTIHFKTLDLSLPWQEIESRLLSIVSFSGRLN